VLFYCAVQSQIYSPREIMAAEDTTPKVAETPLLGVSDAVAAADDAAERAAAAKDTSTLSDEQRAVFETAYASVRGSEGEDTGVTRDQICDWVAEQYTIDVDADTAEGGLKRCVTLASLWCLLVCVLWRGCGGVVGACSRGVVHVLTVRRGGHSIVDNAFASKERISKEDFLELACEVLEYVM